VLSREFLENTIIAKTAEPDKSNQPPPHMSDSSEIEMTQKPQTTSHIVSFLSGGVGGISAVLVGA
jgi:hypothetical protein